MLFGAVAGSIFLSLRNGQHAIEETPWGVPGTIVEKNRKHGGPILSESLRRGRDCREVIERASSTQH